MSLLGNNDHGTEVQSLINSRSSSMAEREKGHLGIAGSVFSFVCACVGSGILILPYSLKTSGWIGVLLMTIIAIGSNSTAKLLIGCLQMYPSLESYEDIGEATFGSGGRKLVTFLQCVTLFGVCTVFLIIIGDNMHTLVPQLTLHVWVFIVAIILTPISWLKSMKEIQFLALFGITASIVVGGLVVIKGIIKSTDNEPAVHYFIKPEGVSVSFNIIVFSFGFHSVLPSIACEMKDIKQFPLVANIAVSIIAAIYISVGVAGYYGYGDVLNDNVLENMGHSPIVQFCNAFITLHVIMAYPIPLYPLCLAVESAMGINKLTGRTELVQRIFVRSLLVFGTVFLASVLPYFGSVLSLVSAITLMSVAFILPPVFYIKLYNQSQTLPLSKLKIIYCLCLMLMGVIGMGFGLYFGVKGLIDDVKAHPNPFDHFFS